MSLEQRCAVFKNFFQDKTIKTYKLRKIYRQYGIKKKKLRKTKILSDIQKRTIRFQVPGVQDKLFYYKS